ncbi:MAG: hypothetical protein ACRDQ5_14025, partial [Sciscionella sp.]
NNAATLGAFGSPPDLKVAVRMPDGSDSIGVGYLGGTAPMVHRTEDGLQVTPSGALDHPSGVAGTGGPSTATAGTAVSGTSSGSGIAAAAVALGGVGALQGIAGRVAPLLSRGGTVGVAWAGARGAKDEERTTPSTVTKAETTPSLSQSPRPIDGGGPAMPPPMGGAGSASGASMDSVRGANPYLTATPTATGGGGDPRRFASGGAELNAAGGGQVGVSNAHGGGMGDAHGGFAGPPAGVHGAPATGGPGSMMPPGGAGMSGGAGVGAQHEVYEGASYLVEADDIFDDGRMVAPPVLGGDEDPR